MATFSPVAVSLHELRKREPKASVNQPAAHGRPHAPPAPRTGRTAVNLARGALNRR